MDDIELIRLAELVVEDAGGIPEDKTFDPLLQASVPAPDRKTNPNPPKRRRKVKVEPESELVVRDVRDMSPQEFQELALQALVNRVEGGDVSAAKELLSFTENVYVSSNQDLEEMSPKELLVELESLGVELRHIVNKESVGL